MTKKTPSPWANGPAEILDLAQELVGRDTDTARRVAMILIDNAVEQMVKTFLSLPKRITGLKIPRRQLDEMSENFAALLDAVEEHAADKLANVDLGSIEYYHRLRNQLYHEGFGLTVERNKVEVYLELAAVLFRNLFGSNPASAKGDIGADRLGEFIEIWNRLERGLFELSATHSLLGEKRTNVVEAARFLKDAGLIESGEFVSVKQWRELRNDIVHGERNYRDALTRRLLDEMKALVKKVSEPETVAME